MLIAQMRKKKQFLKLKSNRRYKWMRKKKNCKLLLTDLPLFGMSFCWSPRRDALEKQQNQQNYGKWWVTLTVSYAIGIYGGSILWSFVYILSQCFQSTWKMNFTRNITEMFATTFILISAHWVLYISKQLFRKKIYKSVWKLRGY